MTSISLGPVSRLALGTVQFGLAYGVANKVGRPSLEQVSAILGAARHAGINMIDTAIAYGDSEATLGRVGVSGFDVVTKLPAVPDGCADVAGWVERQVQESLSRLGVGKVHAVLLHRPDQLLSPVSDVLYAALQRLKAEGKAINIGVSVYAPDELPSLLEHFDLDIIQCPFNPIDRRLQMSGWLGELKRRGVAVHIRSLFLQGVLLMAEQDRPKQFVRWSPLWARWHSWLEDNEVSALQACLSFGLSHDQIDKVVLGVDTLDHLRAITDSATAATPVPPANLASGDADLVNPSRW